MRTPRVPLLLALLASLGYGAPAAAQDAPPLDTGVVRGRVFDNVSHAPLEGVTVTLVWPAPGTGGEPRSEERATDAKGEFEFPAVPPGSYTIRYQKEGYRPSTMTDFGVRAGRENRADFPLPAAPQRAETDPAPVPGVEEFVVIASPLEEILAASRMESDELVNTMSAEEISKFAASDVADALRFVPGVNVVEGQFAIIRGLEDRYSSTLYNSAPIPSPDPDRQSVQLDLFPSDIVTDLVIAKTFGADLPSNSSGGSINILTHEYPEEVELKLSAGAGFNDNAIEEFLELQDDNPVGEEIDHRDVIEDELGISISGRSEAGPRELRYRLLFNREQDYETAEGFQEAREPTKQVFAGFPLPGRVVEEGSLTRGNLPLTDGHFDLTESEYTEQDTAYFGGGLDLDRDGNHRLDAAAFHTRKQDEIVQFRDDGFWPNVDYGDLAAIQESGSQLDHRIVFDGLLTRTAWTRVIRPEATAPETRREGHAWYAPLSQSSSFDRDRDLLVYQLNGDHRFPIVEDLHLTWAANHARTHQDEKSFTSRLFFEPTDTSGIPEIEVPFTPEALGEGQFFAKDDIFYFANDVREIQDFARLDGEYAADLTSFLRMTLTTGGWYERSDRDVEATFLETPSFDGRTQFVVPGDTLSEAGSAIVDGLEREREGGRYQGSRESENDALREIQAFSVSGKATLFEALDLLAGVRRESIFVESLNDAFTGETEIDGTPRIFPVKYLMFDRLDNVERDGIAKAPPAGTVFNDQILGLRVPIDPETGLVDLTSREAIQAMLDGEIDEIRDLPSFGFTYRPIEGVNLRGAYSRTVARPSFREMGYYVTIEPGSDDFILGNPQLQLSDVESWDARLEYVRAGTSDVAAISVFTKNVDDPIESIIVRNPVDVSAGSSALFRTFFNNPNEASVKGIELEARKSLDFFGVDFLQYLSLGGNLTYIDAKVDRTEPELARSESFFGVVEGEPARFGRLSPDRRLYGQPEYIFNADVSFHHPEWGTKITLAYFQISDILDAAGVANINATGEVFSFTLDRYIDSYHQLDLILTQKRRVETLRGDLVFKASVKNLTDSKRRIIYDPDQTGSTIPERSLRIGRDYSFAIGYEVPF